MKRTRVFVASLLSVSLAMPSAFSFDEPAFFSNSELEQSTTSKLWVDQGRLLFDNEESFSSKLELIETATKSLDLIYFIFSPDYSSSRMAKALIDAAQRGVQVRLLLDYQTNYKNLDFFRMLEVEGNKGSKGSLEVRFYNRPTPNLIRIAAYLTSSCEKEYARALSSKEYEQAVQKAVAEARTKVESQAAAALVPVPVNDQVCAEEKEKEVNRYFRIKRKRELRNWRASIGDDQPALKSLAQNVTRLDHTNSQLGRSGRFFSGLYSKNFDVMISAIFEGQKVNPESFAQASSGKLSEEDMEGMKTLAQLIWQSKTGDAIDKISSNVQLFFGGLFYGDRINPVMDQIDRFLPMGLDFEGEVGKELDYLTDWTHHKLLLADGKRLQMGGRNIEDSYHLSPSANNPLVHKYLFMDTDIRIELSSLGMTRLEQWQRWKNYGPYAVQVPVPHRPLPEKANELTTDNGGPELVRSFERLWNFTEMVASIPEINQHAPNHYLVNYEHRKAMAKKACEGVEPSEKKDCVSDAVLNLDVAPLTLEDRIQSQRAKMEANIAIFEDYQDRETGIAGLIETIEKLGLSKESESTRQSAIATMWTNGRLKTRENSARLSELSQSAQEQYRENIQEITQTYLERKAQIEEKGVQYSGLYPETGLPKGIDIQPKDVGYQEHEGLSIVYSENTPFRQRGAGAYVQMGERWAHEYQTYWPEEDDDLIYRKTKSMFESSQRRFGVEPFEELDSGKAINYVWRRLLSDACSRSAQSGKKTEVLLNNAYFFPAADLMATFAKMIDGTWNCQNVVVKILTNSIESTDLNVVNLLANQALVAFFNFYNSDQKDSKKSAEFRYYEMRSLPEEGVVSLHSKVSLIGDTIIVGSANADLRSYLMDTNNAVVIRGSESLAKKYRDYYRKTFFAGAAEYVPGRESRDYGSARVLDMTEYWGGGNGQANWNNRREEMKQQAAMAFEYGRFFGPKLKKRYGLDPRVDSNTWDPESLSVEQKRYLGIKNRFLQMVDQSYRLIERALSHSDDDAMKEFNRLFKAI